MRKYICIVLINVALYIYSIIYICVCVRVFINRPHEALGETWHASVSGVPEAACVLDIAGAIAWISQIATFVQPLGMGILHHRRRKRIPMPSG